MYQTDEKPAHLHLAFTAENRQQVEAFYRAVMEAGGKDNGAPGLSSEYHANYYAAFVIGSDGHNIEVVCHKTRGLTHAPPRGEPGPHVFWCYNVSDDGLGVGILRAFTAYGVLRLNRPAASTTFPATKKSIVLVSALFVVVMALVSCASEPYVDPLPSSH